MFRLLPRSIIKLKSETHYFGLSRHASVRHGGREIPALEGLAIAGIDPVVLCAKEGLAPINGTQVSTALAFDALFQAERMFSWAAISGALSVEAMLGSITPLDARIHRIRNHPGQQLLADAYRALLNGSGINSSHSTCDKVQDPYSLRCQPQVMGAVFDSMSYVSSVLLREGNAVTDNPLIFTNTMEALSGGNFHAEPVTLVAGQLAVASENKSLAHPASVDSLPTSANQEDHVSMATFAARRLRYIVDNTSTVIAIELLAAAQDVEFHCPFVSSTSLESVIKKLREFVPTYDKDRFFAPDIESAKHLVRSDWGLHLIEGLPGASLYVN